MHAWLSPTTRGLRSVLRSMPHALTFFLPLAPEVAAAESSAVSKDPMSTEVGDPPLFCSSVVKTKLRCHC